MPTIAYASFCCPKDRDRAEKSYMDHMYSHGFVFDEKFMVFQRCEPFELRPIFKPLPIKEEDYKGILASVGVPYPDDVLSELTHGWTANHYFAHHLVNHIVASQAASSDYLVFADGDCCITETPVGGPTWVEEGIRILERDDSVFVVSPSDGRPHGGKDRMMSQQMFLVNRKRFRHMEFIPWDGKFIDGGPFQEFYGLLEGFIYRHMVKYNLYRYVLPQTWRWQHKEWH